LGQIIELCAPDITITDECLEVIASTIRCNARSAVKRSKEIMLYCKSRDVDVFGLKHFEDLSDHVGILPYGLTHTEKQILLALQDCRSATLTGLAAKIGMSKTALQRDHELYLLNRSLIEIDGKRKITNHGLEICKSL